MAGQTEKTNKTDGRWELAACLVRNRPLGLVMLGGGLLFFALSCSGVDLIPCPLLKVTGLPCPGCGMSRSCLAMLKGNWAEVWRLNPFGPVFALFWAVVGFGIILPQPWRSRFIGHIGHFERRTRLAGWVAGGLTIYGLTRWM